MLMIMKKYFILAAAAAIFAACTSNDDAAQSASERIQLKLGTTSSFTTSLAGTRSVYVNTQRDSINQTNSIGIFIVNQGTTTGTNTTTTIGSANNETTAINAKMTVALDGSSAPIYFDDTEKFGVLASTTNLYYPDNQDMQFGIFAYAPHTDASTTDFSSAPTSGTNLNADLLTVTPATDQTSMANYIASDVLWGKVGYGATAADDEMTAKIYKEVVAGTNTTNNCFSGVTGHKGTVKVPMQHTLAKVTINLIPNGMAISQLKDADVQINVDYLDGTMNLTTGAVTKGTKSATSQLVTLTNHLGLYSAGGSEITIGDDGHPNTLTYTGDANSGSLEGYSASAVIIPQKVYEGSASDEVFIKITLSNGTVYAYKGKDIDMTTAGKEYIYNIKVSATGLVLATSVKDWTLPGSSIDQEAVLQ